MRQFLASVVLGCFGMTLLWPGDAFGGRLFSPDEVVFIRRGEVLPFADKPFIRNGFVYLPALETLGQTGPYGLAVTAGPEGRIRFGFKNLRNLREDFALEAGSDQILVNGVSQPLSAPVIRAAGVLYMPSSVYEYGRLLPRSFGFAEVREFINPGGSVTGGIFLSVDNLDPDFSAMVRPQGGGRFISADVPRAGRPQYSARLKIGALRLASPDLAGIAEFAWDLSGPVKYSSFYAHYLAGEDYYEIRQVGKNLESGRHGYRALFQVYKNGRALNAPTPGRVTLHGKAASEGATGFVLPALPWQSTPQASFLWQSDDGEYELEATGNG